MNNDKSFIEHGGDIYTEGKFKGVQLIDFSSNINFLGIPKSFINNIPIALEEIVSYPDLKYREAKGCIRAYLKENIVEENIILGNGAAEIINLAIRSLKKPCIVVPSFSEYEATAKIYSNEIVFSHLKEDFSYNYKDIFKKLVDCDGLVIGNPNNPNGGVINKGFFKEIIDYCEEHKKRVIIDEAFVEFALDENISFIDMVSGYKCLFIIRALTKIFAMPGVRLGYGVCSDVDFVESLSNMQIPWNINTFAEIAIKSVLKDEEYLKASRAQLYIEKKYFSEELKRFNFIQKIYESNANFLLIKLDKTSGEDLFNYCISKGILIRRCRNFRGLDDSFIRLAIKSREDNEKLLLVFKEFEKDATKSDL